MVAYFFGAVPPLPFTQDMSSLSMPELEELLRLRFGDSDQHHALSPEQRHDPVTTKLLFVAWTNRLYPIAVFFGHDFGGSRHFHRRQPRSVGNLRAGGGIEGHSGPRATSSGRRVRPVSALWQSAALGAHSSAASSGRRCHTQVSNLSTIRNLTTELRTCRDCGHTTRINS